MTVDLEFSAEQNMLREMVAGICEQYANLDVVRSLEDDPAGYPDEFWKQLVDLDLLGLTLPEAFGGSGQSLLEAAVVYEEFGRSLSPSPHFVSCVVSAGVIERAGSDDQKARWLPKIASGEVILTPAWLEPEGGFGAAGIGTRAAETAAGGFTLSGTKRHVEFAQAADRLVVVARTGDAPTDIDAFLVDPNAPGVTLTQQMTIAADTQFEVTLDGVEVSADDRVGTAGSGWAAWDATMYDALVLLAAKAVGGARHTVDITTQYSLDREQFDKPLGAFQAIAHYLADADTAVEGATVLTREAAWAASNGRSVARLAPMAKLFSTQTFRDATAMAQQVWGGVGFTVEYDVQLYFRRAKQLQIGWWDTRFLEEMIASDVLDS